MKKVFFAFVICAFSVVTCFGQTTLQPRQISNSSKGVVYSKEVAVDMRVQTKGFALAVNIGKMKTYYLTRFYHFEIGELKHPKETRQNGDQIVPGSGRTSRSFIFGKINSLYALRAGIGEKRYLSEKAKKKGVAIGFSYEAGFTLGLLKPYYLELNRESDFVSTSSTEKYSEENKDFFLDHTRNFGSSGFTKGLSEIKPIPGGHFKLAAHFDWGAFDEFVKAMEVGIMGDVFFQNVPIMAPVDGAENRPFFLNLFISLQLGKRW